MGKATTAKTTQDKVMERTPEGYRLGSGRTFYAYNGRLSPPLDGDVRFAVAYGHDGMVSEFLEPDDTIDDGWTQRENVTPAERREIADYMIDLWNRWAARA